MDHQRREDHHLHPPHSHCRHNDSTRAAAEQKNYGRRNDGTLDDHNEESSSSRQQELAILSKSERKRLRERKRRSDVNKGFDALAKILVKVDPQFREETRRFWEANKRRDGALFSAVVGGNGGTEALPSDVRDEVPHFLNRSELINRAVDIMSRLNRENEDRKHQIDRLKGGRATVNRRGDDDDNNNVTEMPTRSSSSSVSSAPVSKFSFFPSQTTDTSAPKRSSGMSSGYRLGESSSSAAALTDANNGKKRRRSGSGLVNDGEDGQRNDDEGPSAAATQGAARGGCPPDVVCSMMSDLSKRNRVGGLSNDVSHRFGSVDDQERVLMVIPMMVPTPCELPSMHGTTTAPGGSQGVRCPAPLTTAVPSRREVTFGDVNRETVYRPLQYQAVTPLAQRLGRLAPPSILRYPGLSNDCMIQQAVERHYLRHNPSSVQSYQDD